MANTTNLGLPLMAAAQSQKHITHNDAILSLDVVVQLAVKSAALTAPPGSPVDGDRYIVGSGATGAWAGKDLNVTYRSSGQWVFLAPRQGWIAWNEAASELLSWTGTQWQNVVAAAGAVTASQLNGNVLAGRLTMLGVGGATADATNRLSINSAAALFNNAGSSFSLTLNKAAAANDASLTLQSGFSSRVLLGLLGDDHFTLKMTPDGSAYRTGLVVSKDTAAVSLVEHPKFSAFLNFGQNYAAGSWLDLLANNARHNDQGDLSLSGGNVGTFTAPHDGYYMFGVGATYEATGGTAPVKMQVGLSVNNAVPTGDTMGTAGDATVTDGETQAQVTAMLKLTAGQTVRPKVFFTTNAGRVKANENFFWGCQIA